MSDREKRLVALEDFEEAEDKDLKLAEYTVAALLEMDRVDGLETREYTPDEYRQCVEECRQRVRRARLGLWGTP